MLFLHNSYGTLEFLDCVNLVGADCMGNLRWANTELSTYFRKTNTDPSVHFRKANTNPSMHFRKANTEFCSQFYSQLTISLLSNSKLSPLYSLCFVHIFFFCSKVASLQFQANGTCRQTWKMLGSWDPRFLFFLFFLFYHFDNF